MLKAFLTRGRAEKLKVIGDKVMTFVTEHPRLVSVMASFGISITFMSFGRFMVHEAMAATASSIQSTTFTNLAYNIPADHITSIDLDNVVKPNQIHAVAFSAFCGTCMPHEAIIAKGEGELICPPDGGTIHPNTQIKYNAIVTISEEAPAKGDLIMKSSDSHESLLGKITSGVFDSVKKTFSLAGTTTSDNICGASGSDFTINGKIGNDINLSVDNKLFSFDGVGKVKGSPIKD
jgi:hypothetical protein